MKRKELGWNSQAAGRLIRRLSPRRLLSRGSLPHGTEARNPSSFVPPPTGAEVWIEFERGDPGFPVWTGCLWGGVSAGQGQAEKKIGFHAKARRHEALVHLVTVTVIHAESKMTVGQHAQVGKLSIVSPEFAGIRRVDATQADGKPYAALIGSVYTKRSDEWKLAFHQH